MKYATSLVAGILLLAPMGALQAGSGGAMLRSTTTIVNSSRASWWLEPGFTPASFMVAETYGGQSLVATARTLRAPFTYELKPGVTVNLRPVHAGKAVAATFHLRDQHGRVTPLPCLSYRFETDGRGWLARCLACCFTGCTAPAPGPATLEVVDLDSRLWLEAGLESPFPGRIRIAADQWPELTALPEVADGAGTEGPALDGPVG